MQARYLQPRTGDTDAAQRLAKENFDRHRRKGRSPPNREKLDPAVLANSEFSEINAAVAAKNYDAALKQAETLLSVSTGEAAIRIFQLQARIYQEEEKPDLAAAALLRIAAHYPSSLAAPAA